jgi:hypothetical protein
MASTARRAGGGGHDHDGGTRPCRLAGPGLPGAGSPRTEEHPSAAADRAGRGVPGQGSGGRARDPRRGTGAAPAAEHDRRGRRLGPAAAGRGDRGRSGSGRGLQHGTRAGVRGPHSRMRRGRGRDRGDDCRRSFPLLGPWRQGRGNETAVRAHRDDPHAGRSWRPFRGRTIRPGGVSHGARQVRRERVPDREVSGLSRRERRGSPSRSSSPCRWRCAPGPSRGGLRRWPALWAGRGRNRRPHGCGRAGRG